MTKPLPKKSVRGSKSGVAIMALFDLLGRKWNMRVMWELRTQPLTFRALQEACGGISPSVLNTRIKLLNDARLLQISPAGYELTELGETLMETLDPLRHWALQWEKEIEK